ncbi:hypothetical protein JQC72_06645 [Polycladomyces sp. WAk]|uniref:Uncharacterized protein n=1 Tax=Polycladomyces zharkentensis TaxID=2807616 RepID=A0ABS2WIB1_9BACL|nr:hypothetical protein [Polycladomyces sp. WAk]MBN2909200.1 hypothetical protein [Polycladomyces sp. WAk]
MNADKLKKLKDQLDLVIRMVEERKKEKYHKHWDEALKQYRKIRRLLDQEIQDISEISSYETVVFGLCRNAYDSSLFEDYFEPLAVEMEKVLRLLRELDQE